MCLIHKERQKEIGVRITYPSLKIEIHHLAQLKEPTVLPHK
jgi:hypothetical protein